MSPRPYQLGKRKTAVARTRERILQAARDIILDGSSFSMDEVARRADVARMTLYYQFGSRRGLIDALFDDLAEQDLAKRLPAAFSSPEPLEALQRFTQAFTEFWRSNHLLICRLRALSVLDPELAESLRARDDLRRAGSRMITLRLSEKYGRPLEDRQQESADVLHALTGFGFFDTLAESGRNAAEIGVMVERLTRSVIGLEAD